MLAGFDISAGRAALTPDKIAFEELETGEKLTFADLDRRATQWAEAMGDMGLARGDRIAILTLNCTAFFEILFGCAKAGVILVPINWRLTAVEMAPLLDDCGAKYVLHDAANAALAAEVTLPLVPVLRADEAAIDGSYQARRDAMPGTTCFPEERDSDDIWYMLYTSGTTGMPKAVIQTYSMAMANYINIGQSMDLTSNDVTPNFLPLFHTAGINLLTLPVLIAGGSAIVMQKFDEAALLRLIDEGRVTAMLGVPAIYQALSLHADFDKTDLRNMRSWSAGGAALPHALIHQFHERGADILQGFGMTETGPTVFLMDKANLLNKVGYIGKPQLLTRTRIVDGAGNDQPAGTAGELLVKGPNVTPGYWNRPDATKSAIDEDGWLHTGDVAVCDEDGYYRIVDRIKDMFISGGENVYPAEVEKSLITHPDILEAAVIGLPDEKWGEVGHACLIARPGHSIDVDSLTAWSRERLAGYKVPKTWQVKVDFPRTPAGKVQKHILRKEHAA